MRRKWTGLLLGALALGICSATAVAGFSPLPVETLHTARVVSSVTLTPEPDGRAVLAWTGQNGDPTVMTSQKPAGGPFGIPKVVSTTPNAQRPSLVRGPDGTMLLAYSTATSTVPDEFSIRPPTGDFGAPQKLPTGERFVNVGIDAAGNVTAVWKGFRASGLDYVASSTTRIGDPFPAPAALTPDFDDNFIQPRVAVTPTGATAAVWEREDGATDSVIEARIRTGATYGPLQVLDRGPNMSVDSVTATPGGELIAVWHDDYELKLAVAAPGASAFGEPIVLDALAGGTTVATRPGLTAIAWAHLDRRATGEGDTPPTSVRAALRPAGGALAPPVTISETSATGRIVLAGSGFDGMDTLLVAWSRHTTVDSRSLEIARRPAGGPFEPAESVTALDTDDSSPVATVLPSGNVLAAWSRSISDTQQTLRTLEVRQVPNVQVTGATPLCVAIPDPKPAPRPQQGQAPDVGLTAEQLGINQRIGQAAIRRLNAIREWLDAGLTTRDLCGGAFGPTSFQAGITTAPFAVSLAAPVRANPRPIEVAKPSGKRRKITLSKRQLLINQRVYQSAVRRANAIQARLDAGLTGGDIRDGAVTQDKLFDRLRVTALGSAAPVPASKTILATPAGRGDASAVVLSKKQVRTNQRVAQAAVRRANQLQVILLRGFQASQFQPGTIGRNDLAPGAQPGL